MADVNEVKRGRVGRRIGRRVAGKATGMAFRRLFGLIQVGIHFEIEY